MDSNKQYKKTYNKEYTQIFKSTFFMMKRALCAELKKVELLSIKQLTLLGFSFVVFPLAFSLLYSVNQINQLSKQGTDAIFDVAKVIKSNRELRSSLNEMQRYASQYLVLKDSALVEKFLLHEKNVETLIKSNYEQPVDSILRGLTSELSAEIEQTNTLLQHEFNGNLGELTLKKLQAQFRKLNAISNKMNDHTNQVIGAQAAKIRYSATVVNNNMFRVLLIIPATIVIAAFFIFLITKPLKLLKLKIQKLEQGDFQKEILFKGSNEVKEIADALEMMRARLYELELQKSSFIRHISHELKTPLAAIREGSELLYDNSVGELNEDQQEIAGILKTSTRRLQYLIEDLLNFNVVLDATSLQNNESLNFSALVLDAISQRKLGINRKNITINNELEDLKLFSNKKQLDVILDNLLSNAINYSPDHGEITLNSVRKENKLVFTITDQGCGIEASEKNRIFNAFYQGNKQKDNMIKSSGLGLTIVKELLTRLQGSITVSSTTDIPSGTSISIELLLGGRKYD